VEVGFIELSDRFINPRHIVEVHNEIGSHWRIVLANGTYLDVAGDRAETILAALRPKEAPKRTRTTKKATTN
jgi:hypothetical protein